MNKVAPTILNLLSGSRKSGRLMLFVLGFTSFLIQAPSPLQAAATIDLSSGYFGNQAVVNGAAQTIALGNSGGVTSTQVSFRFTPPADERIGAVCFHGTVHGTCPSYNFNLEKDAGDGTPDGVSLEWDSFDPVNGWNSFSLYGDPHVYRNTVYHLVVSTDATVTSNNYFSIDAFTDPFHQLLPLDQTMDGTFDVDEDDTGDGSWNTLDEQPVVVIQYDFSSSYEMGSPYVMTSPISVCGTTVVGEEFQAPSSSPWVSQVGVNLLKAGSPNGVLQYDLEDVTSPGAPITGTMATNLTATASYSWVDVALPGGPIQLVGGHRYRLSFSSAASSNSAFYIVNNPSNPDGTTPINDDLSFDGTNAYTVKSINGGGSYTATAAGSDLSFRLKISSAPTMTFTPTSTRTATRTPTRTTTPTMTPTLTVTASFSPTSTATRTSTLTATPMNTFTPNPAWTPPCAPSNGTFGNTTNGMTDSGSTDNSLWATRYTLSEAATITSMAVYVDYQSCNNPLVQTAIYTDNAGSPGNLIVSSPSQTLFTIWNYLTLPATVLAPGTYWLSYQATSGTGTLSRRSTWPTSNDTVYAYSSWGAFPTTFPSGYNTQAEQICIYAVYCPVSPYTPIVTMTATPTRTQTPSQTFTPTTSNTPIATATLTSTLTMTATPSLTPPPVPTSSYCPGFGATVPGVPESPATGMSFRAAKYTLSAASAVTAVAFYMDFAQAPSSCAIRMSVYSHDNNLFKPNVLMTQSAYVLNTLQTGWNTIPVTMAVLPAGDYWLGAMVYAAGVTYQWWGTVEAGGVSIVPSDWSGGAPSSFTATVYTSGFHYDFHALCGPMPTSTPTLTQTSTQTFSPTSTSTDTPSPTFTSTSTVTATLTPSFTFTDSPTASPTPTWTSTWTPMDTSTSTPTDSPTASPTSTWTVTNTFTNVWTPTATPSWTDTSIPTSTGTPTLMNTPTNTRTLSPTPIATATWTSTLDPTPTWTISATPINTATTTWTSSIATATPIPSSTPDGSYNLSSNVFRPSQSLMNVDYAVRKPGHTTVKVFNVAGELVRLLVDQDLGQGVQRVLWDGRNRSGNLVGSGFYLIKIETPSATKTLRVIVRR